MTTLEFKVAQSIEEKRAFCKLASSHRLFVSGWELGRELASINNGYSDPRDIEVAIAFDNNKPIAISFKSYNVVQCFVRVAYRLQGVGSQLVKGFITPGSVAYRGTKGSDPFWKKNAIRCRF